MHSKGGGETEHGQTKDKECFLNPSLVQGYQEKDLRFGLGASFCCSLVPWTGSVMMRFELPFTTYTDRAGGGGKLLAITSMAP